MVLTLEQLIPGFRKSLIVTFDQKVVSDYVSCVRDDNPIHADQDFARQKCLQGPVVPGGLIDGTLVGIASSEFPFGAMITSKEVKFRSPLYVGDPAELIFQIDSVKDLETGKMLRVLIEARNGETTYVQGKITVFYVP